MRLRIAHGLLYLSVAAAVWPASGGVASAQSIDARSPPTTQSSVDGSDPFVRRGWHVDLSTGAALEAWNYNISQEEIGGLYLGFAYGLGGGVTFIAGWPLSYISQRGVDGWMLGATFGLRGRVARAGKSSLFWEFEVGLSEADTPVPPRGTRFNFLAQGGAGVAVPVKPRLHLVTALEWIHVSNGGLPAGRGRNPDIEAIGLRAGLLIAF